VTLFFVGQFTRDLVDELGMLNSLAFLQPADRVVNTAKPIHADETRQADTGTGHILSDEDHFFFGHAGSREAGTAEKNDVLSNLNSALAQYPAHFRGDVFALAFGKLPGESDLFERPIVWGVEHDAR
jgi:hypothetical protein